VVNLKKKMSDKKKLMAYVLNKDEDFSYSMDKISQLMDVSQSTISTSIKEVTLKKKIYDLENELSEAKRLVSSKYENQNRLIKPIRFIEEDEE